jgi:hypothetical protein
VAGNHGRHRPPAAIQARYTATAAVSITGWVLVVRSSSSFGPSAISLPRSKAQRVRRFGHGLVDHGVAGKAVQHADGLRALAR